jgi:glutamate-ammonia-ligase adenylyltransferase
MSEKPDERAFEAGGPMGRGRIPNRRKPCAVEILPRSRTRMTAAHTEDDATLIDRACGASRYLARLLGARPLLRAEIAANVGTPLSRADMQRLLHAEALDEHALKPALRRLRARVFAQVAVRDLCGLADLAEVTGCMSDLADLCVASALEVLQAPLAERFGAPLDRHGKPQQLMVIGMGKLGGRELNVSSDVDLIFVYAEDGETAGPHPISHFEFFTRLGRRLVEVLNDITGEGQVFRVDLRLRPNGDSGPLAVSLDMLENYFVTQGREWERYAWIKARALCGGQDAALAAIARPFVFRKYLDYGALNAMRDLHAQIRREVARRDMANNVKLGPGGIREIEFIAQVFQLIRAGRDPWLQVKPTLVVLERLAARGVLPAVTVVALKQAYDFLRRLEHRLQYVEDQQTHDLPERPADQALIAETMGFAGWDALRAELERHRQAVSRQFELIFSDRSPSVHGLASLWNGSEAPEQRAAALAALGYAEAQESAQRLARIRASGRYQQMPPPIRSRFDALMPQVIEAAAATANPDETLQRLLDLMEAISRRGAYLALLQEYPQALQKVAQLMSTSSWAADYLKLHPVLLDELLDARILELAPDWPAFRAQLGQTLDEHEPDAERQMDLMREAHHAQVFRLLTQDLSGLLTVEKLADHLSELADIMMDLTIALTWRKMRTPHREVPRFAIVAYGKLGGKELGYASDLDLIFLFDDDAPDAAEIYARLAQRIVTWVTSRTSAGILFDTDLRLRPNGDAGLLVTSIEAFRQYQRESAWVWEHQALTRARFCAGDRAIGAAVEAFRIELLRKPRARDELRREVLAMRARMRDAHANRSGLFDLKHDRGGLIDVEFIVQFLVLGHAHAHARLTGNLGNIALLRIAAELGLIPVHLATRVGDAYREFRRLQHGLRLNNARHARVEPASVADHRDAVLTLWDAVFETAAAADSD